MSETTRGLLPDGFEVAGYQPMLLKGASQPQAIYELQITLSTED
jgi:hypothetical protein